MRRVTTDESVSGVRVRQPPHGLVDVDVLQREAEDGVEEHKTLKQHIAVDAHLRDLDVFRRHEGNRDACRRANISQQRTAAEVSRY